MEHQFRPREEIQGRNSGKQILILCECCLQAREITLLYEYAHPVNMTKERKDTVFVIPVRSSVLGV
ncbi:hypothetical protein NC653_026701 [Populus alba x Populus x berolinensis]|uniref:Uncharacterized protein n=1 Tax=Populus alba x Populus x berolinensis TaxID=444605 RepID=A0AAD6M3N7_9ROSI|nr:hypothetical protein NC653_026701 [Populus alba x Populus x berolinensis]